MMLRKNVGKKCGDDFKMKFQIIQKRPNFFMLLVLKFKNTLKTFDVGMWRKIFELFVGTNCDRNENMTQIRLPAVVVAY